MTRRDPLFPVRRAHEFAHSIAAEYLENSSVDSGGRIRPASCFSTPPSELRRPPSLYLRSGSPWLLTLTRDCRAKTRTGRVLRFIYQQRTLHCSLVYCLCDAQDARFVAADPFFHTRIGLLYHSFCLFFFLLSGEDHPVPVYASGSQVNSII
jgi:hypothetical protein